MLSKLTPSLGVSDLPRSLGFYHDALGFEVLEHYGEGDPRVWCHLGSGKAELMLQQLEESQLDRLPRAEPCWVMVVRPEDAGEILKRL
jgi:catechol 2,3-dioxygenase-like lactoylglutathione lyase family enzyme